MFYKNAYGYLVILWTQYSVILQSGFVYDYKKYIKNNFSLKKPVIVTMKASALKRYITPLLYNFLKG